MELYSCVYKASWTCVLIFFSSIRKKAGPNSIIQSKWRLGAFENNANYLDAWLWIEKFKSQLKWSVNLIPVKLKLLVLAIKSRLLVVSQALLFSILWVPHHYLQKFFSFLGTPVGAHSEWQQNTEIPRRCPESMLPIQVWRNFPQYLQKLSQQNHFNSSLLHSSARDPVLCCF